MPWLLEEKHGREQLKLFLLAAGVMIGAMPLFVAWLTWDVWVAVHEGERTIASARQGYQMNVFLALAANAYGFWGSRDVPRHLTAIRRFRVAAALALLVCAAIPAAALMALPAPPAAAQGR